MGDIAQRGNRLTFAKGGTVRRPKKPSTHGKDVPTMAAEGGRIGLNKGGKPWGTGPKPGTHEFLMQHLNKPKRKSKAIGGAVAKGIGALAKKFKKKKVYPETEDLTHQVGPYVGDVGSEGKKRRAQGPKGKGKSPGREGGRPWRGTPPGRSRPGGRIGKNIGGAMKAGRLLTKTLERLGGGEEGKPHSTKAGRIAAGGRRIKRGLSARQRDKWGDLPPWRRDSKAEGGRIGLKKGGSDKKWIQKAVNPKHKGYCTPMTKKTCTPARKALARTFKKKAKTGW